jgi:hypothetical protein
VRVRRNVRKRTLVNNSDISLAGTSSRLHEVVGVFNSRKRVRERELGNRQSHDDISKAVPKATCAHQCRKLHALSLGIERVSHARTERRRDGEIRVVPAQGGSWVNAVSTSLYYVYILTHEYMRMKASQSGSWILL